MTARAASSPENAPAPQADAAFPDWAARPLAPRVLRFLAAVSALCGVAAFPASAFFDLQSVDVRGNATVPTSEVLRRVGIGSGDSVFHVNAFQISGRLRSDPRIQDAWISLAFPRTLTISVRERTPVAALLFGEGYVLLGADGVAITRMPGPGPYLPLRVDRLNLPWVQAGTVVPSADVRLAAGVAGSLPAPLRSKVAALRVDPEGEVVLQTHDGIIVRVGGSDGIADRLAQVSNVLTAVRARGLRVEYVDLRFPGSVIVKPVDAPGPAAGDAGGPGGAPFGARSTVPGARGPLPPLGPGLRR